jgi:glycosyltransferase involved in cell wall biosynthesis
MPGARSLVAFDAQPASVPEALITVIRRKVDQINEAGGKRRILPIMLKEERYDTKISIIIPAYNEAEAIGVTLSTLLKEPKLSQAEIIVVDDGSNDKTTQVVRAFPQVHLYQHRVNLGYGAAVTTGMRNATRTFVIWFDSDGQHQVEDLINVAKVLVNDDLDYCIGIRQPGSDQVTRRVFGKSVLRFLVQLTVGRPVADFNSGLRGFKRELILNYLHLLPKGFSASTTTTLLMLERNHLGREVPITTKKRIGKSTVKNISDGYKTTLLIMRILLLFKPFMFFGSIGFLLIAIGAIYGFREAIMFRLGFPVFGSLLIISGFQILLFGILSDQISLLRRERLEK